MKIIRDEFDLRRLQLTQLEILKVIDAFCKKHHIHYSLYAGTLLGAVRHKGFIPWDDDLDICMKRSEYNRFVKTWLREGPEGYIIQNKEIEPNYVQSFTKIRKDHTAFLQEEFERGKWHTGIFVDVFPIDRIPKELIKQKAFYLNALFYQLYTREFVPPLAGKATKVLTGMALRMTSEGRRRKLRQYHYRKMVAFNRNQSLPMVATEIQRTLKQILPSNLMDEYVDLPFEDGVFPCMKRYKEYLTIKFGDYNQLPPEEERTWRHHPIILDFEHNLDEL